MLRKLSKAGVVFALTGLVATASLGVMEAEAEVRVKTVNKYYTVTGTTGKQLFRSIIRNGPKGSEFQHAIATTQPDFKFRNFEGGVQGRNCKITKVDIDLKLIYTYPRWRDYKKASPELQKRWDKFYRYLVKHEEQHGKIAVDTARSFERRIRSARGRVADGCAGLETSLDRRIIPLVRRYQFRQASFDRREGFRFSRISRAQSALLNGK